MAVHRVQLFEFVKELAMWRGIGLSLLLLFSFASVSSAVVSNIAGINVSGPKPNYPLTISIECTLNCPTIFAPSYTDEERLWGGTTVCRTSIDRGVTWADCAGALPVTFGSIVQVAETAQGAIVVAGRPFADAPASCVIYRSSDSGATWTLVHSGANQCSFAGGDADANHMWCAADGTCALIFRSAGGLGLILTSTDDGLTWGLTNTGGLGGIIQTAVYDGSSGGGYSVGGVTGLRFSSGSWSNVTLAAGYDCWGSFIQTGQSWVTCHNATQAAILDGLTGLVSQVISLSGASLLAGTGILSTNFNDQALYVVAAGGIGNLLYVSIDGGSTFVQIYAFTSVGVRGGTAFVHPANNCVYFGRTNSRIIGVC